MSSSKNFWWVNDKVLYLLTVINSHVSYEDKRGIYIIDKGSFGRASVTFGIMSLRLFGSVARNEHNAQS